MLVPIQPRTVIDREDLCLAPWLLPLIKAAHKGDSIIEPLQDIVRSMGFGSFLYGVGTSQKLQHDERFYLWTTVPPEWVAEYDKNSYVEIDPRVSYGWATWPPPLMWDRHIGDKNPRVAAFLDRAAAFGIGSGLAVYLRDGGNKIMFALNCPQRVLKARDRERIGAVTSQAMYLGTVLHSVFMSNVILRGIPPIHHGSPLSARERQCLQLSARGMTSYDIGLKLAITERTANFHFSNIISKMGVLNRLEAIAMGVAHGLIQVDARAAPLKPLRASKIRDAQLKRWEARRNNGQQPRSGPVRQRNV
jgi:DNA-binding CsgD family transcriptional regulator